MTRINSLCAVVLPLSLGLGLIYLSVMGRMEPLAAVLVILGIAVLLPLAASVATVTREERLDRSYRRVAFAPRRSVHVLPAVDGDVGAGDEGGFVGR